MNEVYVVRNQEGQYLSKQREWVSGRDASVLYRTPHKDEAVNTVFEVSAKDLQLRAEPLACTVDHRQLPQVEVGPELEANATAGDAGQADANPPGS